MGNAESMVLGKMERLKNVLFLLVPGHLLVHVLLGLVDAIWTGAYPGSNVQSAHTCCSPSRFL